MAIAEWRVGGQVEQPDVVNEVSKVRQELNGEIVVYGSLQLVRTLIQHDLVHELRLMIYPVVLGAGERLFGETSDKKPMRLVDTQTVGDGVAFLTYEPVREVGPSPPELKRRPSRTSMSSRRVARDGTLA